MTALSQILRTKTVERRYGGPQIAVARVLLEQGANTDLQDRFEMTVLHRAVKKGNLAVTQILLEMGATIDLPIRRYSRRVCGDLSYFWRMEQTALHPAVLDGQDGGDPAP